MGRRAVTKCKQNEEKSKWQNNTPTLAKAKKLQLSVDIQCHLFDHLILPILLHGSEIWGYEDISQIEVLHRKFLRTILFVSAHQIV